VLVAHPEPVRSPDLEVLDHGVGPGAQLERQRAPLLTPEVESARALAAVHRQVVGRFAAGERGAPRARLVAALGTLDLDHVGAQIGQQHRAIGARQDAREIDHADPEERLARLRGLVR
jgi:hypothetical protein